MAADEWHYVVGGTSLGPHSTLEMEGLIARGQISPQTLVWNPSLPVWEPAAQHFVFQGRAATGAAYLADAGIGADGLYVGAPSRGFMEALQVCFAKYVAFSGRASRSEYWYFVLWQVLIGAVTGIVDAVLFTTSDVGPLNAIASLALILPTLAVSWRRMHDLDRSGWWIGGFYLVIFVVVFVGSITYGVTILDDPSATPDSEFALFFGIFAIGVVIYSVVLLVWYCTRGTLGPNRYG